MKGRVRLFLYGTLQTGEVRHRYLAGQCFVGEARTAAVYRLLSIGGRYPGLIDATPGRCVRGELWDVDESTLAILDAVEGIDEGLYVRRAVRLADHQHDVQSYFWCGSSHGHADLGDAWPRRSP